MGWSGGTEIFDTVVRHVAKKHLDRNALLTDLYDVLSEQDWDAACESVYTEHPLVRKVFEKMNPNMYED